MAFRHMSNTALHNGALAQTAPDPIITIDEEGTILFANAGAEEVFEYSASELIGQPLTLLIPERLRTRHEEGMGHYLKTGQKRISWRGMRVPIRTKSGAEVPVEIAFGEFEWDGRRVFSGFLRDISERVASEQTIAAANERLQHQANELVRQVAEARILGDELATAKANAEIRAQLAARSADRARRLLALSVGLNSATGTDEVAELILEAGLAAVHADAGGFAIVSQRDGDTPEFEVIQGRGFRADLAAEFKRFPLQPGRPMSDAIITRAPVLVRSREDARERYPTVSDIGYEAFVALPVVIGERPVAVIGFSFSKPQLFDEPTETFLRTVGELCAQALERARLFEDGARHARHSSFLADASHLLASSLDYEVTLRTLAKTAVPTFADCCIVDVVDEQARDAWPPPLTRVAFAHDGEAKRDTALALMEQMPTDWDSDTGLASALRDGTTHFVPTVTESMLEARGPADGLRPMESDTRIASVVIVPLTARGRTVGALTLLRTDPGLRYDEHDVVLATNLAARAATAIDNARLFRAAQQAREVAEDATARADAASDAKSNFLATMSHEIRTPINAVLGYSELLEMELAGPLTSAQRDQLSRIRASTGHLLTLVNEVLDLAKIESGTLRVHVGESIAGDSVNAALSMVSPQAAAKGVTINERCEGACDAKYIGDPDRVRQVLTNLMGNAVKFTRSGGSVSVRCSVVEDAPKSGRLVSGRRYIAFEVADTGVGIPAEDLDRIFEAFVQAEPVVGSRYTRESGGTGLGLAISRQLAHGMSGEITVESKQGQGSTFTLYIPAAPAARS
jgi:PAS domain S-box-containing protein